MGTAALLHISGRSENTTGDLRCSLEVPAGSGPRPFLLQSPGSGPSHTVRAQSMATAGLQGHHPAACCAHSPLPSQAACHMSPEPRVRVLKGRAGTRESGSPPPGPGVPRLAHLLYHTCTWTPPPSGPQRPPARAGSICVCLPCPGPPARGADSADGEGLRRGEHEFSLYFVKIPAFPLHFSCVSTCVGTRLQGDGRARRPTRHLPWAWPAPVPPHFQPKLRMLSCSLAGLTARPWPRGGGSGWGGLVLTRLEPSVPPVQMEGNRTAFFSPI